MATSPIKPYDEGRPLRPKRPQRPVSPRIEKYDVETEIGHGDLVRVFRAFDRDLGRPVTLKVLTDLAGSALTGRFRAEVATAGKLRNPHIIAIYALGEHVGLPFAAMQVLGDNDLRQTIRAKRPLSLLQKMLVLWQVAEGVRAANLGGLAHVGLRPSGIALEDGSGGAHAIIQDFGIVRINPETENEAAFYAAPEEQTGNFPPDSLCDIFAFGTICYEWLGGAHPFLAGDSSDSTLVYNPPRPLRDLAPECPDELARLVHRAIDPLRELRYQNLDELQDDFEPLLRELKRESSTALLADVQQLIDAKELEQAQSVLREVLQLDPDNREANRLRADVRTLLLAQTLRPRIEAILHQADRESAAGGYGRAVDLLETALRLDNTDVQVAGRLEQARSRLMQSRRSSELVAEARQFLEQQALSEARAKASEALECDPGNAAAAEVLRTVDEALERRDRESQIEEELVRAKSFLLLEEFDSAIAILSRIDAEFPGSPLVEHWLEHVRKQAADAKRQRRFQSQMREARSLLAEQRYNGVIVVLTELTAEFPEEPQISDLLDQACLAREHAEVAAQAEAQCQELCGENRFEEALEILDSALAAYPLEPALARLRQEVEERRQESKSAAEVSKALSQVRWLLDQGRPDLAAQFLRDKAEEYPGQEDLANRLTDIEKILPGWEKARFIEDTLGRVAALEQLEQWPVALTVVQEALETYPSAPELLDAAERLRSHLSDRERRKKLARRLDAIRQKVSIESWSQAFLLIDAAQTEFPGEPELALLRQGAEDGRRRAESENIVREVRQCLADGEPERAQEMLEKGIAALPADAALRNLEQELKTDQKYREDWHTAQVLFGRRQFQKAEQILVRLASLDRPEAALLLEKVREARAASEEEDFYKHGREKALKLIQQQQFEQAADLLRNLLTLFPGDPILERDLQSVQSACDEPPLAVVPEAPLAAVALESNSPRVSSLSPAPAEAPSPSIPLARAAQSKFETPVRGQRRLALTGAVGLLLLVSATAAVWKLSHGQSRVTAPPAKPGSISRAESPVTPPAVAQDASPLPTAATQMPAKDAVLSQDPRSQLGLVSSRPEPGSVRRPKGATALPTRPFTLPPSPVSREPQSQSATLPTPPGATPTTPTGQVANLPASLNRSPAPTPPPPAPAANPVPDPAKAAAPAAPTGGRAQEAQLLVSPKPILPVIARQQKITGTVNLVATIDATGKVKGVKVLNGHPILSGAAVDAVSKWRYRPATLNGQPIETTVAISVLFSPDRE